MKNLRLFAVGLLGSLTFLTTSCGEDDEAVGPILTVNETATGSADGSVSVPPGETLRFEWDARAGDADLDMFTIRVGGVDQTSYVTEDGNSIPYDIGSGGWAAYQDAIEVEASMDEGSTDYVFIIEDADGLTEAETITVVVEGETTELTSPQGFTWERQGSNDGTGLSQFGLEWTSNTSTRAIVTKDDASRMVMLDASDWNDINTVQQLADAVEAETEIAQYDEVSVTEATETYNDVLGVRYNDQYYMLHITESEVETGASTKVTVMGHYRTEP